MTLEGEYTATVDRVVEGLAVFLVESDGETVDERRLPASSLPADVEEGTVCELTFEDDEVVDVEARPEATADRRSRMRERFESLSRRLGDEEGTDEAEGDRGGTDGEAGEDDAN